MRTPKYRKHTATDRAFVEFQGRRTYLPGPYDSARSREAYQVFLTRLEASRLAPSARRGRREEINIAGLVLAFLDFARLHYPTGHSSEYGNCRAACKPLLETYGDCAVRLFGPRMLKHVQNVMIGRKWSRDTINSQIGRIKRMFKWGVSEELVPLDVFRSVQTVAGLRRGRTAAKERPKRQAVAWELVEPILAHLPPNVALMVRMQWLTGARSQSICAATPSQFDRSELPWSWRPRHKTEHLGREAVIFIGPVLAKQLEPLFDRAADAALFDPRESAVWWQGGRANRRIRKAYDTWSYRQAIRRAQAKAGVPLWTPHQLRHARATSVRAEFGLEAAQAVLCHDSIDATQIYAARRSELAKAVAMQTG